MSTSQRRRLTLALCAFGTLASSLGGGLYVAQRDVETARQDLLREETAMAVELLRGTGDMDALDRFAGDRWRLSDETIPLLDEAAVNNTPEGLVGLATVYDADSWFETGTLHLAERTDSSSSLPLTILALSACAMIGLGYLAWLATRLESTPFSRRLVFPGLSFVALAMPLGAAIVWATESLEHASVSRITGGSLALGLVPELDSLIAVPGGVSNLTGAAFVIRSPDGDVEFSSLPTTATAELNQMDVSGVDRVAADRIKYLVTDVGRVRLAVLPYDQSSTPAPTVFVLLMLGVLLAALPVTLTGLVDQPRAFHRHVVAWSFLAPASIHLAIFTLGPLVTAAWLSLHRWSLIDVAKPFVGLANYSRLLADASFWNAIKNTVVFALHVPASMAIALALALVIQRKVRGIVFIRAMLFLPTITSLVAVAMVWQWMLHDEYGLFNWILSLAGIDPIRWLSSPSTALLSLMIMATWMVVGYQMILFQAGLAAIPSDLYDAARIDGAGVWRRFVHVTLPGLRHTLFFVLVTSVIGSFQVFGAVYVMTEGGPLHATDVAVFHIYQEAWEFLRFGDAAAMSWVLFAIIFFATWVQFRTLERRAEAEA